MRTLSLSLLFLFLLIIPCTTHSQTQTPLWNGIISPSRATDWSNAGIPGGIPSGSWTQCGSTIQPYGTSSSAGSPSTIQSAITACGTNQYVLLAPGNFYLSGGINLRSNMVLRGSGADSTFLHFASSGSCNGWNANICMAGSNTYEGGGYTQANWTGGFSQGSTSITLSSVAGIVTNLTPIVLDECNTGFTGTAESATCAGSAVDNGGDFVCETVGVCSSQGANTGLHRPNRAQEEVVVATAISGTGPYTVTVSPAIRNVNWAAGMTPEAWWGSQTITNAGVENLYVDSSKSGNSSIATITSYQTWVKGVASYYSNNYHVRAYVASHPVVRDSYFYWTTNAATQSYGVGGGVIGDMLIENNIMQGITDPINFDSACSGCVVGYNFSVNQYDTTLAYMFGMFSFHGAGESEILLEGNIGNQVDSDDIWGAHTFNTIYRNYMNGYESNNGTMPTDNTDAIHLGAFSRYYNVIGNVLGNVMHHTTYQCVPATSTSPNCPDEASDQWIHVYDDGWSGNTHGKMGDSPDDTRTGPTSMRWGNYDVVNAGVLWCGTSSDTSWSAYCAGASEVPTADAYYPNSVPTVGDTGAGMPRLPFSLHYSATPNWWPGSVAWPPIGPDVSTGNIGQCTTGTYKYSLALSSSQCAGGSFTPTVVGGHAVAIPAMACYLNTMAGTPDGTGSMLSFNPTTCYGTASIITQPGAPTNVSGTVQTPN